MAMKSLMLWICFSIAVHRQLIHGCPRLPRDASEIFQGIHPAWDGRFLIKKSVSKYIFFETDVVCLAWAFSNGFEHKVRETNNQRLC